MDVLLVAPSLGKRYEAYSAREYLGLEYVAAFLRHHGYHVGLLNCNVGTTAQKVAKTAVKETPMVVGISIPTLPNVPGAFHIVENLHAAGYTGHITLGGHVATFGYHHILRTMPAVTSVVRGEGEHTFYELVQTVASGSPLGKVKGIAFKDADEIVVTAPRPLIKDIDVLPFPARDFLEDIMEKIPKLIFASVATGRGCYGGCTFCSVRAFYELSEGPNIRLRSPKNIVDELEDLMKQYGISVFTFVDDNFIGPGTKGKKRAADIAQEILERGLNIKFTIYCRPDDVDEELFTLLQRAGLVRVFVGIEAGVSSILKRFRKGTTVEENSEAITILRNSGLSWGVGFILYDPDTTFEEFKKNVQFIRETGLHHCPANIFLLNGLTVYPGTPVEAILKEKGRLNYTQKEDPLETLLNVLGPGYKIPDPRVQASREVVDVAKTVLNQQFDTVWPLFGEWDRWIESVMNITGFHLHVLSTVPEFKVCIGDQLDRWRNDFGMLVINILETMITFFDDGNDPQKVNVLLSRVNSMIEEYNMSIFGAPFEEKIAEIHELLNKDQFEFQVDGMSYVLSVAKKRLTTVKSKKKVP